MTDKFSKVILVGILICLIVIGNNSANFQVPTPSSTLNVEQPCGEQVIQLAPNRIAVIDNNISSGMRGTILIFDYDSTTKKFNYRGTMNYSDYFLNPDKYGIIPTN